MEMGGILSIFYNIHLYVPSLHFAHRGTQSKVENSNAFIALFKPLSVTTNVVGLQTDDADHVDQNSSAHVACIVGLQTDAVVVTETHFSSE